MIVLKVLAIIAIVLVALFLLTLVIYFFNLDMKFAAALINKKLEERKLSKACKIVEINDETRISTKYFSVGFFNTVHSIPDSLGVLINTPNGRLVHTGDFKYNLIPIGSNYE